MSETEKKAVWPGWTTTKEIGHGSYGTVYEIERNVSGHTEKAALKHMTIPQNDGYVEELRDSGYDDESITATFKVHLENIVNEYTLMCEMNGSANVVNCHDFSILPRDNDIGWDILIKMELLTPLTKAISGKATEEQVLQLANDMCSALMLCKKYNIVHRDIKPQNIFVSKNGDYKLGDFGIAKTMERTSRGTKIGTYNYMAPEVYHDQPYNQAADIYSLGLVLHWLLNDKRAPFMPLPPEIPKATDEEDARKRRFDGEALPAPAYGSEELKRIVLKACASKPKDRYQSAEEMKADLKALEISAYIDGKANTQLQQAQQDNSKPDDNATIGREQSTHTADTSDATMGGGNEHEQKKTEEHDDNATIRREQSTHTADTSDATMGGGNEHEQKKTEESDVTPIKRKWWIWIAASAVVLTVALIAVNELRTDNKPESKAVETQYVYIEETNKTEEDTEAISNVAYDAALSLLSAGNYQKALDAFEALDGYKDSSGMAEYCRRMIAEQSNSKSEASAASTASTTSTVTPAPVSTPGPDDVKGREKGVQAPSGSAYLSAYETKTVKSKHGICIYLCCTPGEEPDNFSKVAEGETVTVIARQNGFSFIRTEDGRLGWANSSLLA